MHPRLENLSAEQIEKLKVDIVSILRAGAVESIETVLDEKATKKVFDRKKSLYPDVEESRLYVGSRVFKEVGNGNKFKGESVSYVLTTLREKGWRNFGNLSDFETMVEDLGFGLIRGKNQRGNKGYYVVVK